MICLDRWALTQEEEPPVSAHPHIEFIEVTQAADDRKNSVGKKCPWDKTQIGDGFFVTVVHPEPQKIRWRLRAEKDSQKRKNKRLFKMIRISDTQYLFMRRAFA